MFSTRPWPFTLLYRNRSYHVMGFSGFEGRHYSQFESVMGDLTEAANLQQLVTALAYKYVLNGTVSHSCIPDTTAVESERRQIFFGTAIGIPTLLCPGPERKTVSCSASFPERKTPGQAGGMPDTGGFTTWPTAGRW